MPRHTPPAVQDAYAVLALAAPHHRPTISLNGAANYLVELDTGRVQVALRMSGRYDTTGDPGYISFMVHLDGELTGIRDWARMVDLVRNPQGAPEAVEADRRTLEGMCLFYPQAYTTHRGWNLWGLTKSGAALHLLYSGAAQAQTGPGLDPAPDGGREPFTELLAFLNRSYPGGN